MNCSKGHGPMEHAKEHECSYWRCCYCGNRVYDGIEGNKDFKQVTCMKCGKEFERKGRQVSDVCWECFGTRRKDYALAE